MINTIQCVRSIYSIRVNHQILWNVLIQKLPILCLKDYLFIQIPALAAPDREEVESYWCLHGIVIREKATYTNDNNGFENCGSRIHGSSSKTSRQSGGDTGSSAASQSSVLAHENKEVSAEAGTCIGGEEFGNTFGLHGFSTKSL